MSLCGIHGLELPEAVEHYAGRYAAVGHRDEFLWRWCWRAVEQVTLPAVPADYYEHVQSTKLLAIILTVLIDDLADRPGGGPSFEYALGHLALAATPAWPGADEGAQIDARYLALIVELWAEIERRVRELPGWERFAPLWYFDYQQVFTSMRYSALTQRYSGLDNLVENRVYVPHNMNMMLFATLDLMVSSFDEGELGQIRQALWHAQSIGQIGNMLATWRREAPDRDFASRVFTLARDSGVLDRSELAELPVETITARIEQSPVEAQLLAEVDDHRRAVAAAAERVRSIDMRGFPGGVERLLAMSLAARGAI